MMRESLSRLNLTVLNILILLAAATLWMSSASNYGVDDAWASGFFQNFSTEMFGAFATLILVEIVIGSSQRQQDAATLERLQRTITNTVTAEIHRVQEAAQEAEARHYQIAQKAEIEQEKERRVLQMGSPSKIFAVEAARTLHARGWGWGQDTTLEGAHLRTR